MKTVGNFVRGAFLGALLGFTLAGLAVWVIDRFKVLDAIDPDAFRSDESYFGTMSLLAFVIWITTVALGGFLWLKFDRQPRS